MKMFANTRREGFARWKFVVNIFIFFLILRGVASLVESEASKRGRNTTCSLRLTRQKVLIQEVEDPENAGKKQRIRRKYGSENGDGYMPPDIVVEEFRIRAKINFQAHPRTRRVAHTEISNHTKTRIGSPSFRDRRLVYGNAESLIQKNSTRFDGKSSIVLSTDRSINIEKKSLLSEATAQLPKNMIFNSTKTIKLTHDETSLMLDLKKKSDRDHREIGKLTKKVNVEFFSKIQKKRQQFANENKNFLLNTRLDDGRFSESKNEEIERPKSSPMFLNFNDKSINDNSREIEKSGFRPRYRKSKRNVKIKGIESGIKKNTRYFDATRTEFFDENEDLFTRNSKGFLASKKLDRISKWYKNIRNSKIKSMNDKTETENAKVSPFVEDYEIVELKNNEIDRPSGSSVSYNLKKKLSEHNEENKRIDVYEKCREKSPKNDTISFSLRLKKREVNIDIPTVKSFTDEPKKFETINDRFDNSTSQSVFENEAEKLHNNSDATTKLSAQSQENKSPKSTKSSTITANKNSQKKTSNQSAKNNKKKKSRSESSLKKMQSKTSNSSASKNLNSTRTNTRVEKRSNNTMWNFALPSVIGKYFAFISFLLDIGATANKNHPAGVETNKTISPSVNAKKVNANASAMNISDGTTDEIFQNITNENNRSMPLREEIDKISSSNITDESLFGNNTTDISASKKENIYQNSPKFYSENSTIIDNTILKSQAILNVTINSDNSSKETGSPISPKNSRKAGIESGLRIPVDVTSKNLSKIVSSIALETLRIIDSKNISIADNHTDIHDSEKLLKIEDKSKNVTNFSESKIKDFSNFSKGENLSTPSIRDTANVSDNRYEDNEEKSSRLEEFIKYTTISTGNLTKALREAVNDEYPEKTTLNFTIIDPNCTETLVQNSLTNGSLDRSSNVVEVIAPVSTFPTIRRYSRNDSSIDNIFSTKNDVYRAHNNSAKNRQTKNSLGDYNSPNGARRGRVSAMSRGRMRSRYKGKDQYPSIPRIVKNSWRRNNVSATLNLSAMQNTSNRPGYFGVSKLSRENRKLHAKPHVGGFPETSTVAPPSVDRNKLNAIATEETIYYEKSTFSKQTEITRNAISRPTSSTSPAVNDFSNEENKSGGFTKKETEPVTVSSIIDFSMIDAIGTSPTGSVQEENRIAYDKITTKKISTIGSSTVSYDKSISGESTIPTISPSNESIVTNDLSDVDKERKIDESFNEFETANSKREDIKESFAGRKIYEFSLPTDSSRVSSETKRNRYSTVEIFDNNMSNESTTRFREKSIFADSTILNETRPAIEKIITVSESPSITENEIISGSKNTPTTDDESVERASVHVSMANGSAAEKKFERSSVMKSLSELKYSTPTFTINEPSDSPIYSRNSTDIYAQNKLNESPKIRDDFSFEKKKNISQNDPSLLIFGGSKNHRTTGSSENSMISSQSLENKTHVNYSSMTRHPDSTGREFFTKEDYALITSTETSPTLSSSNVVRKARDSRAISDYDDRREPEFDYDIDASAEIEPATEKTIKSEEDDAEKRSSDPGKLRNGLLPYRHEAQRNIEGPRGSSTRSDTTGSANTHIENSGGIPTTKSSLIVVGLPHSAVHDVFFEDGETGVDSESTVTPTNHRMSNDQSVRDTTARLGENFNVPYEFSKTPENFTNFLDETKLFEFVESLEDFLFDDSVTGTSDRKPLSPIDQDLLAESTNSVAETRSAIFKTKKFSAQNKKIKIGRNTKRSENYRSMKIDSIKSGKKQSARSTTKKTSDLLPIGRKNRPKSVKKKIDKKPEKKIKRDKPKEKFRQVKISKSLMDFSSRRKGIKKQNSTDKIITIKKSEK